MGFLMHVKKFEKQKRSANRKKRQKRKNVARIKKF